MPDALSIEDILKMNPDIDAAQLEEGRKMLERLRESGMQRRHYTLVPPEGGSRLTVGEESDKDPRTVRLRYRR